MMRPSRRSKSIKPRIRCIRNEDAQRLVVAALRHLTEEQREHVIGMALQEVKSGLVVGRGNS